MSDLLPGYPPEHPAEPWAMATTPLPGTGTPHQRPRKPFGRKVQSTWGGALALASVLVLGVAACSGDSTAGTAGTTLAQGAAVPTVAVPPSAVDLQQTVVNVIAAVEPSVVEVTSTGGQGQAIGSGEVLPYGLTAQDGYIVTNDHVVTGFSTFQVQLSNGKTYTAQLKGESPDNDLAVLKITAPNLHPISIGDSSKVQVGQFAIAVGSPLGLTQSATFGIVSAVNRQAAEGPGGPAAQLDGLIQTSAPINPGNSGGALVNLQGQLIGIPTLGAVNPETNSAAAGIGFAIPSNTVATVAQQIIKNGSIAPTGHGFLGIQGEDVTPSLAAANNLPVQSGVLIVGFGNDVEGNSPAQQAGLKVGDIITGIAGNTVNNSNDLTDYLLSQKPGTKVSVAVVHSDGSKANVSVTLGTRPTTTP